jgi:MATE family multidrug resistance protein
MLEDIRRVSRLALPVAIAELGWMAMTTVDTIMVGPLGPAAIGALGVSNSAFYSIAIFGMGLLLGLDTLVSQSHGAGDKADTHHSLAQGVYLAVAISIPLTIIFLYLPAIFRAFGINPQVSELAELFVRTLTWSTLPLLLYGAFRRYLQGIGHVRPVMFVLVSANLVNWGANWLLIQGRWGFPALGVTGSALSTCLARVYMAAALLFFIWYFERDLGRFVRVPDPARLLKLLKLGLPAATQIMLEIGAFGAAAMLAGRLLPEALAAHQIALNCASVSYMVPLGIASASAVLVGQAIGKKDAQLARRNGYTAMGLACAFMACSAIAFLVIPRPILLVYSNDAFVITLGVKLLAIAALFQLFDGMQTVATGALRGLGDTNLPMIVNFIGYWLFGLPVGYILCFRMGFGIAGLWWGLTFALIGISIVLLLAWQRKTQKLNAFDNPEIALGTSAQRL